MAAVLPASRAVVPASHDPLRRLWGPVTVRITHELLQLGLKPRPQVVREIREHTFLHLGTHPDTTEAEETAHAATINWLQRREGLYQPLRVDGSILPDLRWREQILDGAEPLHLAVFKLAYGEGLGDVDVAQRIGVDVAWVRAVLEALRQSGASILTEAGVDTRAWQFGEHDAMLRRIANASGNTCPGPEGLLTEPGRAHAQSCPRCARALRLIEDGYLAPSALFAPEDAPVLAQAECTLLGVSLHPDAQRYTRLVLEQFPNGVRRVGEVFVVSLSAFPDAEERLCALTERGLPKPEHVRGAKLSVRGSWGRQAILGPGLFELLERVEAAPWGEVSGCRLAAVLPPKPSVLRWYVAATLAFLLTVASSLYVWNNRAPPPLFPIDGVRQGDRVIFDVADAAFVDVIAVDHGVGSVLLHSETAVDKGGFASGDGRYALMTDPEYVLVVSAATPLSGLPGLVGLVGTGALPERVRERWPEADVRVLERPKTIGERLPWP